MLIAAQKRKENIVEYILYMFQIEDLIRAFNFDIENIDRSLISQYKEEYSVKREIREWYKSILQMLRENQLEKTGHIPLLNGLINSLYDQHIQLLQEKSDTEYIALYKKAKNAIEELRVRTGDPEKNDVDVCINGLYGFLMLKIQKKTINPETKEAFENISVLMAFLAEKFHETERGEAEF